MQKFSLPFNISLPSTIPQYRAGKKIGSPLPLWIYKGPGTSLKKVERKWRGGSSCEM